MADLIAQQSDTFHRIGRVVENLKKLGSARISAATIKVRSEFLTKLWQEYSDTHVRIMSLAVTDSELKESAYFKDEQFDRCEEAFLDQLGRLRELLEKQELSTAASCSNNPASDITVRHESHSRAALPRIDLPKFSGQVHDWPSFRDLFESLVIKDDSLSDVERFHYLRTSVTGSALLRLRNLPVTEQNFSRAWTLLKERYENTRLLVNSQLGTLFSLAPATRESAVDLRRIVDTACDVVASFESMNRSLTTPGDMLVYLLVSKLDSLSRREWENQLGASTEPPTFDRWKTFIEARINTVESMHEFTNNTRAPADRSRAITRGARVLQTVAKKTSIRESCSMCSQGHILMTCPQFLRMEPSERLSFVRKRLLCLNCLGRHSLDSCRSEKKCQRCQGRHHTSLHEATSSPPQGSSVLTAASLGQPASIVLATAMLRVHAADGRSQLCRALVDPGSQISLICEDVVQLLGLPRRASRLPLFGIAGTQAAVTRGVTSCEVSSLLSELERFKITAYVLPSLTNYKPLQKGLDNLPAEFHNLNFADPDWKSRRGIDVVLGADIYPSLLRDGLLITKDRTMAAQNSSLGWLLTGRGQTVDGTPRSASSLQVYADVSLHEMVERFWHLEEVDVPQTSSPEDDFCENHFRTTHSRTSDGRYVVRLPMKSDTSLGESRHIAAERLRSLERRFRHNAALFNSYSAFMNEYEQLGHMSRVDPSRSVRNYYLPHHGVWKTSSTTTKLRVVFNASQATSNGVSLNDIVHSGPNLLPELPDVLLQWRTHRIALVADIVKMYRQILVHPADRHFQCILWQPTVNSEPQDYQLCTVTYGMACAPFLAIRTLRQLAHDYAAEFPRACKVLLRDVYVDDILTGAASLDEARSVVRELSRVCMAGGFPLQKWRSNNPQVFTDAPDMTCSLDLCESENIAPILGVQWCADNDVFRVKVQSGLLTSATTKRTVLSQIARLFDPIGWLAPIIVWAKCYMQDLWLDGCAWDAPLSETKLDSWRRFQGELSQLSDLSLPRWLQIGFGQTELHGFADASERAYAAVVYVRTTSSNGDVKVVFLGAKTKVAPLKKVSLPRLELNAALLLARLLRRIVRTLSWDTFPIHCWSDSTIVLHWITSHSSRWKTYVANRIAEIQTAVSTAQWHHIAGSCNPADIASRGLTPALLPTATLWWDGPQLLHRSSIEFSPLAPADVSEERKVTVHVLGTPDDPEENQLLTRFSDLERLLRVSCWCLRWRRSSKEAKCQPGISTAERTSALLRWVRIVQEKHFPEELRHLRKKEAVPLHSRLSKLSPYLDTDNVLRVGGRLSNSLLAGRSKTPFILPADSHFTEIFIQAAHLRTLHGGTQLTLANVRQEAWPLRGRQVTKSIIGRCMQCLRWNASPFTQQMSHLPADRVRPSRPFSCVGVDYAGPVLLRPMGSRTTKRFKGYIALFVCLATRAVHLELVSGYDADSFLAAFRRFTGRRGLCARIYSDRGTNFVGAERELRRIINLVMEEDSALRRFCVSHNIEWLFNPPAAPHFGGLWEAGVKSVKGHLRRVLGEQCLNFEEYHTLLIGIEACLNSRPLQALSDDPSDLEFLTPGHFLTGTSLLAAPELDLCDVQRNRLSRWQLTSRMMQHFWKKWSREYLHSLQQRSKWRNRSTSPAVGDLVLVTSELLPPTRWPVARIIALHPGKDQLVRVATVRTSSSDLIRPICKLVPLPPMKDDFKKS